MADVWIPALLRSYSAGRDVVEVPGNTLRDVIQGLGESCPGLPERLIEGDQLRAGLVAMIDGDVVRDGLDAIVGPASEIHFVHSIGGGQTATRVT